MSGESSSVGQVLGASTVGVGGVAVLPYTGNSPITKILTIVAITCAAIYLLSFIITRLVRKLA